MKAAEEQIIIMIDKYGDTILRLAYIYFRNVADAEDAVQDVFLKIVESMPEFNDATHEKAWILRTTINLCKNKLKLFWNSKVRSIDEVREMSSTDKYNETPEVLDAVLKLPEKYRTVIHLYYYEEYTTPEIARLINKNETTVRSLLHRAREKLKSVLKEAYDFE